MKVASVIGNFPTAGNLPPRIIVVDNKHYFVTHELFILLKKIEQHIIVAQSCQVVAQQAVLVAQLGQLKKLFKCVNLLPIDGVKCIQCNGIAH